MASHELRCANSLQLGPKFTLPFILAYHISTPSNMYVSRIHLIEKDYQISSSQENPSLHESCCWKYLDEETCQQLMNGKVYFHLTRTSPAYMSGTIVGFRPGGRRRDESV